MAFFVGAGRAFRNDELFGRVEPLNALVISLRPAPIECGRGASGKREILSFSRAKGVEKRAVVADDLFQRGVGDFSTESKDAEGKRGSIKCNRMECLGGGRGLIAWNYSGG